ncbi:MAG: ABC transporter ATP-binding protein [Candidatus Omnitrophica bacterium CG07_land_8_20_14_0_80_42_15]|uniref:ABC transporter ATP-binding protein n=1 Tax=Candidatus Aquitaenariimonas noxiae TaxID=1974741 RepID=A0A2J0KTT2_9BACT|nr:MAG: ABC transporter ATP-binding protein [Candidatus Omnitrophica bacterium CG07_land_8_20_14_0_80_42_15]
MEKTPVIEIKDLVKIFDGRRVLNGVNLTVYKGETFVLMGGSGCGKSTLLRHMIGSYKPDTGSVWLMGKNLTTLNEDQMDEVKKKFGMLFQSAALFDSMTVGENVALPLREHTKLDDSVINIVVKMKLELVGLRGFENLMPSQLSGGMKKRVGLARAIAMDPEIVFYDEPTAGLDPIVSGVIDKLISDLTKKLSITSVVVTHDMNSVFRIADRIAMLHQGKIVAEGTKQEIEKSNNGLVRQFVKGDADGPVTFFKDKGDYLKDLIG